MPLMKEDIRSRLPVKSGRKVRNYEIITESGVKTRVEGREASFDSRPSTLDSRPSENIKGREAALQLPTPDFSLDS